jgi:hypothetical protein
MRHIRRLAIDGVVPEAEESLSIFALFGFTKQTQLCDCNARILLLVDYSIGLSAVRRHNPFR